MEHEFYECPEYLSNTAAEVERTEEYEYEVRFRVSLPLLCYDRKEAHRNTPGLSAVSVPSVFDRPAEQRDHVVELYQA